MMSCTEFVELIHDYVAGELAVEVHERFERHRCLCGHCSHTVETYQLTIRVSRCLPKTPPLPSGAEERLRAKLGL